MRYIIITVLFIQGLGVNAQRIVFDDAINSDGLWCFRSLEDPMKYYYAPNNISIKMGDNGLPQFSLLRYVINNLDPDNTEVVADAEGGAILNFVMEMSIDQKEIRSAEKEIKRKISPDAKLIGPVIYNSGIYALISAIIDKSGKESQLLLHTGSIPVLEGGSMAFSFELSAQDSKILLESFKMSTPDISFTYDFEFDVYSDEFEGSITANWSDVYKSSTSSAGANFYIFSAEASKVVEELVQTKAIEVEYLGLNDKQQAFMEVAYDRISSLIFQPIAIPKDQAKNGEGGIMDVIKSLTSSVSSLGFNASYKYKKFSSSGTTKINLSGRNILKRHIISSNNIGDLFAKYGDNERIFKTVNLADPDFQQRVVHIGIDGAMAKDFSTMVDNVTVEIRKEHVDGFTTLDQLAVNTSTKNEHLRFIYPCLKDYNREEWMSYEYRTQWQFNNGGHMQTNWIESSDAMINLYAPYKSNEIYIEGDLNPLWKDGLKAIHIKLMYDFFGKQKSERIVYRPSDSMRIDVINITMPEESTSYNYQITYFSEEGKQSVIGTDDYGILFLNPKSK